MTLERSILDCWHLTIFKCTVSHGFISAVDSALVSVAAKVWEGITEPRAPRRASVSLSDKACIQLM